MIDYHDQGQVLLVDKPVGHSSFYIVKRLRSAISKAAGKRKVKVGHAGTLDPLASGLLILCTGSKTKTISEFQGMDKVYTGVIRIGCTTPSFDSETEVQDAVPIDHLTETDLDTARLSLTGTISQVPPLFSAVKIDGKRAYKLARQGSDVQPEAREVRINEFSILNWKEDLVRFRIACSKGTYIRSMARDFGLALGVGGYLTELRRESIGPHSVSAAKSMEDWEREIAETAIRAAH